MDLQLPSPLQKIENDLTRKYKINLYIKRDDLIHPFVSGNKWRKLKYHLEEAKQEHKNTILTVGGAFSNHITATAAACKALGFKSIGIIRGDELKPGSNLSLQFAAEQGMELHFADRGAYAKRNESEFLATALQQYALKIADIYYVPEGGASQLGMKGSAELVNEINMGFDYICCACGTGTTIAGIAQNLKENQKPIGISVLNNDNFQIVNRNSKIVIHNYAFGGYARATNFLIQFIKDFKAEQQIELDYVYTGKMMFGIFDLIQEKYFPENSTIIAVHTGGVQNASVFEGTKIVKPL